MENVTGRRRDKWNAPNLRDLAHGDYLIDDSEFLWVRPPGGYLMAVSKAKSYEVDEEGLVTVKDEIVQDGVAWRLDRGIWNKVD